MKLAMWLGWTAQDPGRGLVIEPRGGQARGQAGHIAGRTPEEVALQHVGAKSRKSLAGTHYIPPMLDAIVMKCLEKHPLRVLALGTS